MKKTVMIWGLVVILTACETGYVNRSSDDVKIDGSKLKDSSGEEFIIKSISLGNWLNPEGYMWGFSGPEADSPRKIEKRIEKILGKKEADKFWNQYYKNYIN